MPKVKKTKPTKTIKEILETNLAGLKVKEVTLSQSAKINLGGNSYSSVESNFGMSAELQDGQTPEEVIKKLREVVRIELELISNRQVKEWKKKMDVE